MTFKSMTSQVVHRARPLNARVKGLTKNAQDRLSAQTLIVRDLDRSIRQNYGEKKRKFWKNIVLFFNFPTYAGACE